MVERRNEGVSVAEEEENVKCKILNVKCKSGGSVKMGKSRI
jgi:hypothetical protein